MTRFKLTTKNEQELEEKEKEKIDMLERMGNVLTKGTTDAIVLAIVFDVLAGIEFCPLYIDKEWQKKFARLLVKNVEKTMVFFDDDVIIGKIIDVYKASENSTGKKAETRIFETKNKIQTIINQISDQLEIYGNISYKEFLERENLTGEDLWK